MIRKFIQKLKQENAQGIVEFALILPILLLVVVGIMEIGHMLFVYSSVVSASREGARYAASVGEYSGRPRYEDCEGIRDAAMKTGSFTSLNPDQDIKIYYDDGINPYSGDCDNPPPDRINLKDRVVVSATLKITPIVPLFEVFFPEDGFKINSVTGRTLIKDVGIQGTVFPTDTPVPTPTPVCPPLGTPTHDDNVLTLPITNVNDENVYFLQSIALNWPLPGNPSASELQSITFGEILTQTANLPDMPPKYEIVPNDPAFENFIGHGMMDTSSEDLIFTFEENLIPEQVYQIKVQFTRCSQLTTSYTVPTDD